MNRIVLVYVMSLIALKRRITIKLDMSALRRRLGTGQGWIRETTWTIGLQYLFVEKYFPPITPMIL